MAKRSLQVWQSNLIGILDGVKNLKLRVGEKNNIKSKQTVRLELPMELFEIMQEDYQAIVNNFDDKEVKSLSFRTFCTITLMEALNVKRGEDGHFKKGINESMMINFIKRHEEIYSHIGLTRSKTKRAKRKKGDQQ